MNDFTLDTRLQNDCHILGKMGLSHLLLMNNAHFPWFILVPETDVVELCDLDPDSQRVLLDEINRLSRFIKDHFPIDKLNVAAIGNVVKQLHIHVIGRRTDDPCWPGVVWGSGQSKPYSEKEFEEMGRVVRQKLKDLITNE